MSRYENRAGDSQNAIDAYTRALLDLLGDQDPVDLMSSHHERIAAAVRGLDDRQLRQREHEGKWSIAHVVQHLADSEVVSSFRFRMTLAHDAPPIAAYDQDRFANLLHYEDADVEEALEMIRVLRRANLRLLRSLTAEEWQRGGIHAERGFESVDRLTRLLAAHDLVHLRQIERIRAAIGV
jgi:hypothetical protein